MSEQKERPHSSRFRDILTNLAAIAGIISCLLAAVGIFVALILGRQKVELGPIVVALQPAETATTIVITALAPTQPPLPTYTSLPTYTIPPEPTNTKPPPATATPDDTILFKDSFNSGLASQWETEYGNPLVVNNTLTADKETWLSVGDSTWTDYKVEFEADAGDCWLSNRNSNVLAVRLSTTDRYTAFVWADCESDWFIYDGNWNAIPHTEAKPGYGMLRIIVAIKGTELTAFADNEKLSSYVNTEFKSGGIGLRIAENTVIDNFTVTKLDQ